MKRTKKAAAKKIAHRRVGKATPSRGVPTAVIAAKTAAAAAKKDVGTRRKRAALPTLQKNGEAPAEPKTFTPYIQPVRWPREINLDRVVKRKDMGDITGLARSIDERNCLLQPIVIYADGGTDYLVAGQRRLAAWPLSKFRKEAIPVHVVDVDSIIAGEWDENAKRKDFAPSEKVEMMQALLPIAKAAAKARQQAHGKTAPGKKKAQQDPAQEAEKGEAVDHLARYLGSDRKTLEKAAEVVEAARESPEKFGYLLEKMDKSGKVSGPFNRLKTLRQVDDIRDKKANGKLDLPDGKFDRAVIDYAWPHEPGNEREDRATRPYATMPIAEGVALMGEIAKRLAKNATVYFWTTNYHMQFAYTLLRALGLTVAGDAARAADDPCKGAVNAPTIITWVKDQIGRGQRLREQTEHCIVAIKGNPVWNLQGQSTVLRGASGESSEKPAEFYALIDDLSPAQRTLGVFERRVPPEGWAGWGDQVGKLPAAYDPNFETFGNIAEGLLKVLGAIERGEPVAFNENDHVVRGLYAGKKTRKLTRAGKKRLAELRVAQEGALTLEQKAERDRERLAAAAERAGHSITVTLDGEESDQRKSKAECSCGKWASVAFMDDAGLASQRTGIADHQRSVAALELRAEAADKTAKRGSRRAQRPPADGDALADARQKAADALLRLKEKFPDGVTGHVISHHSGDRNGVHCAIATCECGQFEHVAPWGDHAVAQEEAIGVHWSAVADFAQDEPSVQPAEAAE